MDTLREKQPRPNRLVTELGARLFSFDTAKILALELQGFLLCCLAFAFFVVLSISLLAPIVVVCSNGAWHGQRWEASFSMSLVLLLYAFFVGTAREPNTYYRIAIQWLVWSAIYVLLIGTVTSTFLAWPFKIAIDAVWVAFGIWCGMWVGRRFDLKVTADGVLGAKYTKERGAIRWLAIVCAKAVGISILGFATIFGAYELSVGLQKHAQVVRYLGKAVPDCDFVTSGDETWTLAEHKGKIVLMEYWHSKNDASREVFPFLRKIHERFGDHEDFVMVSIYCGTDHEAVKWFEAQEFGWPLLFPTDDSSESFRPRSRSYQVDVTGGFIVDRKGVVANVSSTLSSIELNSGFGAAIGAPLEKKRCSETELLIDRLLKE